MSLKEKNSTLETANLDKLPVEKIVDLIRAVRISLIKDFLKDDNAGTYFSQKFNKQLSTVKREFLLRDMRELLISPVDLVQYASLIRQIRETNQANLSSGNYELFYEEIDRLFEKYMY